MRFGVLGPLEARADDEQLTIKGAKERRLVGLLLSRANRVVAVDDIIEALWGTDPPRSAAKSVQVYVVRVRKMLEPNGRAAGDSMVSRRGVGYALSVGRGQVDALRFEDLVARAREAAAAGAYDIAAEVLREALSLWRGSAYADFQDTLFGATEAARLEEMRLASLEARIDADLVLGRHVEVTAELEALVRECPLRERFWSQLMLALYRGGRQSDALLAFRRARGSLIEEIGVAIGAAPARSHVRGPGWGTGLPTAVLGRGGGRKGCGGAGVRPGRERPHAACRRTRALRARTRRCRSLFQCAQRARDETVPARQP
jgi:DNA-binding SARP family transcriptional activator